MPHGRLSNGLYLLKQRSSKKPIAHYGVLDVGNRLGLSKVHSNHPVVIHQSPPAIQTNWLVDTGDWEILGRVHDELGAIERLNIALSNPGYDVFGHNCEQFARFVATGRHESSQLHNAVFIAGVVALAYISRESAP